MPVVAVVGGIASAVGAAAGATALIGGTITLSTVASGLAFVGGIASALGGITGNKKLMKFGMIAGVGGLAMGGVASMMGGAGSATSATTLATGDTGLGLAANATGEGLQGASMGIDGIGTSFNSGVVRADSGAGMLGAGLGDSLASLDTGVPSMVAEAAPASVGAAKAPVSYAINDPAAINVSTGGSFAPNTSNVMSDATSQFRGPGDTGSSVFGKFGNALKTNPELVKAGSGILGGLGQAYMQGQQQKEQERMASERRSRLNASILGQRARF